MDLKAWTDAQRAVIGSLLLEPDRLAGEVFQKARPKHFQDAAMRHLFEAARRIWEQNRPLDPVTLAAEAGDDYTKTIAECMQVTPTAANCMAYLEICRDASTLSALQAEALAIINAETTASAMAAYERLGETLQRSGGVEHMSMAELVSDYLDRMHDATPPNYLRWGLDALDAALYVSPGQFGVIAADSSSGKTALALQFAYYQAEKGKRVGFISLETPWESLGSRLMAERQVAGIPLPATHRKQLSEEDWRRAGEAGMKASEIDLHLFRNCFTLPEIRSVILQWRLDVVFIDYVQLVQAEGRERWDIVTNISMGLHRMAQQLGTVVIGLSQITPAAKGAKQTPTKDDLRESRQLKQDADFILMLYPDPDDDAPPNGRVLEIAKNKDGRLARMHLNFEPAQMTFSYQAPSVSAMRSEGQAIKNRKPTKAPEPPIIKELADDEGGELPF